MAHDGTAYLRGVAVVDGEMPDEKAEELVVLFGGVHMHDGGKAPNADLNGLKQSIAQIVFHGATDENHQSIIGVIKAQDGPIDDLSNDRTQCQKRTNPETSAGILRYASGSARFPLAV